MSTLPTSSSPGSSEEGGWSAFGHSSSHSFLSAEIGKKRKRTVVSYLTGAVNFLFVLCSCFPGYPSLATAMLALSWGTSMSLLENSVGASLLHNLLNLILFMYPVASCYLRPFIWLAVLFWGCWQGGSSAALFQGTLLTVGTTYWKYKL